MSSRPSKTSIISKDDGHNHTNNLREPSPSTPNYGKNTVNGSNKIQAVFIHKLYDMLEDTTISHLIWWAPTSDSFYLLPGEEFSNALSQYFKHTNIASFIRQLNMYGFHKVNDTFQNEEVSNSPTVNKWEFKHSTNQFRKGDLESLKLIKRRSSKNVNSHKEIINLKSIPTSHPVDYDSAMDQTRQENYHQLLQKQHQIQVDTSGTMRQPIQNTLPLSQGSQMQRQQQQHQQQQQQQQQQQPPTSFPAMVGHPTFEASVNYKLLEYNNSLNSLRNDYYQLHNKYDSLYKEYKKSQSDMLTLVDILERHALSADSNEKRKDDEKKSPKFLEEISTLNVDLKNFRANLLQRWNNEPFSPAGIPPGAPQPAPSQSSPYHLTKQSSRHPSATNIIPQQYPLHPQYPVYPCEPTFNNSNIDYQQKKNRNYSVFVDPLQATPHNQERPYSPVSAMNSAHLGSLAQQSFQQSIPALTPMKSQPQRVFQNSHEMFPIQKSNSFAGPILVGDFAKVETPLEKDSYFPKRKSLPNSELDDKKVLSNANSPCQINGTPRSVPYHNSYVTMSDPTSTPSQIKNQLPSVSELDKSIKVGTIQSPVYGVLNNANDNVNKHQLTEQTHFAVKKRKI